MDEPEILDSKHLTARLATSDYYPTPIPSPLIRDQIEDLDCLNCGEPGIIPEAYAHRTHILYVASCLYCNMAWRYRKIYKMPHRKDPNA